MRAWPLLRSMLWILFLGGPSSALASEDEAPAEEAPAEEAPADDAPAEEAPAAAAATGDKPTRAERKAARKARRQAVLAAAIADYESKYTGWHLNPGARWFHLRLSGELGFVGPAFHQLQFGQQGTRLDYLEDGGQDNLFAFARLSVDAEFAHHLVVTFLYQPLDLRTKPVFQRDITVDDTTFPAGTPMASRYGFSFFRLSIGGDFLPHPEREFLLGISAQIRNATIEFQSADGTLGTSNRDIGFVPILKARFRWTFEQNWFLGAEADGWYAAGRGVSGSSNDFDAAIFDVALRGGVVVRPIGDVFLTLRYLGGGATGTDETPEPPSDGYTNNWLHTVVVTLGITAR